ncbi:MAG TPA: hypothetical protein PLH97_04295, partial [Verrucomicrobiota bacterium]|nr:hypothetical protein [Verrucomicrobiota bacterium]
IAVGLSTRERRRPTDFRPVIERIEREHPEVRHLLSTAAEQRPDPDTGGFNFLQMRVIEQILNHRKRYVWEENLERRLALARNGHLAAFGLMAIVFFAGVRSSDHMAFRTAGTAGGEHGITVTPGDTEIERGTGVVISIRFGDEPPSEATLVVQAESGKIEHIPLQRHFEDPVFGATLFRVSENSTYWIEYAADRTQQYQIKVFDYPALTRADAVLRFPAYTGLTNKVIPDTLRITAVEGTRLDYTLELNKPVAHARLVAEDRSIQLSPQTNATALLLDYVLTNSGRYRLELVDADGRTNKVPATFSFQALTNRRPELRIAFPRGDQRVSRLEELAIEATASDDFGLLRSGIGIVQVGKEPQVVELGETAGPNEKRQLSHLIALEQLGLETGQVVGYYAWADDYGPDGLERRTFSDMFFAEIRPFEEIFRRDQSGDDGGEQQGQQAGGGGAGGGGGETTRLAELQKQIVIATWKLQQYKGGAARK